MALEKSVVDVWNLFLQINLRLTKLEELLKSFLLDKPPLTVKGGNSFFKNIDSRFADLERMLKTLFNRLPPDEGIDEPLPEGVDSELLLQLYTELSLLLQPLLEEHVSRLAEIKSYAGKLIYLTLLMFGPKHPSYFWRRLKMHRSTVHKCIRDLKEKGLIIIDGCTIKVPREKLYKLNSSKSKEN